MIEGQSEEYRAGYDAGYEQALSAIREYTTIARKRATPVAVDQDTGSAVKSARAKSGLSQATVAAYMTALGISWSGSTVYKIEVGKRGLGAGEVAPLAQVLGVNPSLLIGGKVEH